MTEQIEQIIADVRTYLDQGDKLNVWWEEYDETGSFTGVEPQELGHEIVPALLAEIDRLRAVGDANKCPCCRRYRAICVCWGGQIDGKGVGCTPQDHGVFSANPQVQSDG